jgi:replication initiation protein RepC
LGATDRALAILQALLSCNHERAFYGDSQLVVWPSNDELSRRTNGMSPATLRRHLANLVDCGLVIRRDSPNGKRYARKGSDGEVERAYGLDLTPVIARAAEFKAMAENVRAEERAKDLARERLTICRRDIVKMIALSLEEGIPGNWEAIQDRYREIIVQLPRTPTRQVLDEIAGKLEDLWFQIRQTLESFINSQNMSANESHIERHIQNTNPESKSESESGLGKKEEASGSAGDGSNVKSLPERELPLNTVMNACPKLLWLVKDGSEIRHWREFLATAELARPVLGVSPSAWEDARVAMGERAAAITLAVIYQKQDADRAKEGKFSVWPMVLAELRGQLDAAKAAGSSVGEAEAALKTTETLHRTQQRLDVSDSLRQSLAKGRS